MDKFMCPADLVDSAFKVLGEDQAEWESSPSIIPIGYLTLRRKSKRVSLVRRLLHALRIKHINSWMVIDSFEHAPRRLKPE